MSDPQHKSRIVLITGCSSGFGLLTAARLAAAGHQVYATMRNLDKEAALLSEVNRRGGAVNVMRLDVTDHASIDKVMQTVAQEAGNLDVLVNNAGYGIGGHLRLADGRGWLNRTAPPCSARRDGLRSGT